MLILPSVNCFAADMTPTEMACCAMSHDCGGTPQKLDCCRAEPARVDQSAGVARVSIAAPIVTAILLLTLESGTPSVLKAHGSTSSVRSVKPPGLPTYLAVSSLRI
jgi:hypothetical protein